jgi:type IV pilus assembly protein PilE
MNMLKNNRGFNVVELLVTLSVVGILAGIAYPSYQSQMQKTRRADAEGALLGLANSMERFYTEKNTYVGAADDEKRPLNYPSQSPVEGGAKYYDLTINAATATTYTLWATPISSSAQAKDKCGTLTLNHQGVKDISGQAPGVTKTDCW